MPEGKVAITNLVDEFYPLRKKLNAKYKKGFAYKTIGFRLPVILTQIIDKLSQDKNEIGETLGQAARSEVKDVVGALAKLKNEMITNKPIARVCSQVWNDYLDQVTNDCFKGNAEDTRWYWAPWLFVECYLYHRVYEAFLATKNLQSYDYFRKQKEDGFLNSIGPAATLCEFLVSTKVNDEVLQSLLEVSLWGNRCDLSISGGATISQEIHLLDHLHSLQAYVLADNCSKFWSELNKPVPEGSSKSVGYVLDNAGFELFTDLCFADALSTRVDQIDFFVKTTPWFISDALINDVTWLIDVMVSSDNSAVREVGNKWKDNFESKRWRIIAEPFWTYPHAYYEMKSADPQLYAKLALYTVLVFKGDLNYRKLVGDINWPHDTPFTEALQGFSPAPLFAMRTIKADTVAGLRSGLGEELSQRNPDWMITGEYGLLQFSP